MGRHSTFDPEVADRLLEAISDGASLTKACQEHGIARRTVRQWLADRPDFAAEHKAAHTLRLEKLADDVIDLVDSVAGCENNARVTAARNQADARRWLLSKVLPAMYGDRVEIAGDGGAALQAANPQASIPRLMSVLAIIAPEKSNSELHQLATSMIERAMPALPKPNGSGS